MYSPKLTNASLRKKFLDLGLREDDGGYWYYDPFNNNDWMIAAYENEVKVTKRASVINGVNCFKGLGDTLNCVDDEEKILEQVNKLLNQVKRMDLTKKKKKMRMRMNKLKKDFQ